MSSLDSYAWPRPKGFTPFKHQKETAEFLISNRKAFCFNEQGTGKTASVIWATDHLMNLGVIRRVLVVCPMSIMYCSWQADLFKFAIHRRVDVAYGNAAKRKKIIACGAEYVVVNFDGVDILKVHGDGRVCGKAIGEGDLGHERAPAQSGSVRGPPH